MLPENPIKSFKVRVSFMYVCINARLGTFFSIFYLEFHTKPTKEMSHTQAFNTILEGIKVKSSEM